MTDPCRTCGRPAAPSEKAQRKLLNFREWRRWRRGGEVVLAAVLLCLALCIRSKLQPFDTMLIAAALATTAAAVLVPPRNRKPQPSRLFSPLSAVWLPAFALSFGGFEGVRITGRYLDLEQRRSCNEVAAVIISKQPTPPNGTRIITCAPQRLGMT